MNRNIGEKIKLVLEQKKITIEQLISGTNLRKDQIEIILSNQFTPPLAMLKRIAECLGVTVNILMDGTEDAEVAICRASDNQEGIFFSANRDEPNRSFKFFSLAGEKANRSMEPFKLVLDRGEEQIKKLSSHEGEEFIYVLDGEIEFIYGDTTQQLSSGDSIYFDSVVPHAFKSISESSTLLCMVNSPW